MDTRDGRIYTPEQLEQMGRLTKRFLEPETNPHMPGDGSVTMKRDDDWAICAIKDELVKARRKFDWWPDDPVDAAAIVAEEAGELIRAALQVKFEGGSLKDTKKEAVQTAAMAIRFLTRR